MIVGATGPYPASPMPTKHRVSTSSVNVCAKPDAPLARLQMPTEMPTSTQRDIRPASQPKIGAAIMYESRNAVASEPVLAIEAISSSFADAADAPSAPGKKCL